MSFGSSSMIASDRYGITQFLNTAIPKPKKPMFTREKRAEGFNTEKCESVAQRAIQHLDQHAAPGDLLVDMITNYLRHTPGILEPDKKLGELVYETLSHALGNKYERAVYPETGPTKEYVGMDLYPRSRIQSKADKIAEKLARHLFGRDELMGYVQGKLGELGFNVKLERSDLKKIKAEVQERRSVALRQREASEFEVANTTITDDGIIDGVQQANKWIALMKGLDTFQVSFMVMSEYGTSEIRNSPSLEEATRRQMLKSSGVELAPYEPTPGQMPSRWQEDREKLMRWADLVSLRSLASQVVDPFFFYAQRVPSARFDKFKKVQKELTAYHQVLREYERLEQRQFPDELSRAEALDDKSQEVKKAQEAVIDILGSLDEITKQIELASGLRDCASQIPFIDVDVEAAMGLYMALASQKKESRRAELAEQLAPIWVKKVLSVVSESLTQQSNRLLDFLMKPEVIAMYRHRLNPD